MKISVIVTTFNRPDSLKKVLEGLLNQTVLPWEIIVADDGSTEETSYLVDQMALSSPDCPVRHVWHEDLGFRAAEIRNKAILKSAGDYLISLDGDCIPDRYFIQDHLRLARPGYFFQGKRVLVERELQEEFNFFHTRKTWQLVGNAVKGKISNAHHLIRLPFVPAVTTSKMSGIRSCNMGFFKKNLFAVNGFNQAFQGWGREDSELVARLYNYGVRRMEHPFMAVCFHLWHEENDRSNLKKNDQLLRAVIDSGNYRCSHGLVDEPILKKMDI